jgi:hypothetical protein
LIGARCAADAQINVAGYRVARVPNCSAIIRGEWFGSMIPPAPARMLRRKRTDRAVERKIERALSRGDRGIRKIAKEIGVGIGTVQRVKAAMAS